MLAIASLVSLLLFFATAAMWVRSYRTVDEVKTEDGILSLGNGNIALEWQRFRWGGRTTVLHHSADWREATDGNSPGPLTYSVYGFGPGFHSFYYGAQKEKLLGLNAAGEDSFPSVIIHRLVFPHWFAASLFSLLPLIWIGMRVRHHRRTARRGLCTVCGYDLRASTERCPECGTPITSKAEKATA